MRLSGAIQGSLSLAVEMAIFNTILTIFGIALPKIFHMIQNPAFGFNAKVLHTLLCFFVCLMPGILPAQIDKQDSLEGVLQIKNLSIGERILTMGRLGTHYYFNGEQAKGNKLLKDAVERAEALPDKQFLARTLAVQAMMLRIQGDSTATSKLALALNNLTEGSAASIKGYVWYAKGWMEARDEQLVEATASYIKALQYYDNSEAPTDAATKSSIFNELYSIYGSWGDKENMEKYARLGLKNAQKSGDPEQLASSLYSLAYTFEERYRTDSANQSLRDSAEFYYKRSISTITLHENRITPRSQLPFNALGLANLYSEFYPLNYKDTARRYLDIALKEGLNSKQYTVVTGVYGIMGEYAQRENRWDDAEHYLNQATMYNQMNEMPELATQLHLMQALATVAEKKEDYQSALVYYKNYLSYYKQQFDKDKMTSSKELEAQYSTELKEQKLIMLEEQVAHRKTLNVIYIILSSTIFVALIFLFQAYRQRSKSFKQQRLLHRMELDNIKQEHKISLLSAMIDGQENERARIARDLHDGLGGLLSGLKIELSGGVALATTENTKVLIRNGLSRIDQAVDELRRISRNMMPEILLHYGLAEALNEYCRSLKRSGVNITCQVFNYQQNLSKNKQVVIYRIAQELVNNAVKYAKSSHILVELRQEQEHLSLTVEDDGIGFDIEQAKKKKCSGLQNIEARAVFLNGTLHIDSSSDAGTSTVLSCPFSY